MIHINTVRKMLQDNKTPFSCRVWKKNGEVLYYKEVVCSSSNFARNTANLLFTESRQLRKIRLVCLFEINDEEVFI